MSSRSPPHGRKPPQPRPPRRPASREPVAPTLADLGRRGLRWAPCLGTGGGGAGDGGLVSAPVSAALVREDWIGWTTLVLLLVAAFAALRCCASWSASRLDRLNRIRADVAKTVAERDPKREERGRSRLYARRPGQSGACASGARPRRARCRRIARWPTAKWWPRSTASAARITRAAKRVATRHRHEPHGLIAVADVLIENLHAGCWPRCTAAGRASSGSCAWRTWCSRTCCHRRCRPHRRSARPVPRPGHPAPPSAASASAFNGALTAPSAP